MCVRRAFERRPATQNEDRVGTLLGLRLGMQSQDPWDFGRLGIEASRRRPQRRIRSLSTLARNPGLVDACEDGHAREIGNDLLQKIELFSAYLRQRVDNPVIFPPGRARLATKPLPTGSPSLRHDNRNCSCSLPWQHGFIAGPAATTTSSLRRANSAATSRWRSNIRSPNRHPR